MSGGTRAAVIGCGDISALHLDALAGLGGVELVGVCDIDADLAARTGSRLGVEAFASSASLLDAARPDVVHICTPHDTHVDLAIEALSRGVHVVLEKPVAHSIDAAELLSEAARKSGAKIGVCFQNRYNAPVARAKELIDNGALGTVTGAAASVMWHRTGDYYAAAPWRGRWASAGGGLLMNQAIHTVDLIQWLIGSVETVEGTIATRALADHIEVEDTAEMRLQHTSGATSVLFATLAAPTNLPVAVDIVGTNGTLSIRGDLTAAFADGATETVHQQSADGARSYWGRSHAILIADFYGSLDDPEPFWIGVDEARKSLSIIQSLYDLNLPDRPRGNTPMEWSTSA